MECWLKPKGGQVARPQANIYASTQDNYMQRNRQILQGKQHLIGRYIARFFWFGPWLTLILPLLLSCQRGLMDFPKEVATPDTPAVSPSGKYVLVVVSGHDGQASFHSFQILNQDKKVLYLSPDHFVAHHRTYFLWDQSDRVWVYSSDVGMFFWEYESNIGHWQKYISVESDVPEPEFLKEAVPD